MESLQAPELTRKGKSTSDVLPIKRKTHKVEPIRPILVNGNKDNDQSLFKLELLSVDQRPA